MGISEAGVLRQCRLPSLLIPIVELPTWQSFRSQRKVHRLRCTQGECADCAWVSCKLGYLGVEQGLHIPLDATTEAISLVTL